MDFHLSFPIIHLLRTKNHIIMKTTHTLIAAICGAALLLTSCAKETVSPAGPTPLSTFDYKERTPEQLIEAASPELYQQLLEEATQGRAPFVTHLSGYFIPGPNFPQTPIGTCYPGNSVCATVIVGDRSGGNTISSTPTDIFSLSSSISSSNGDDSFIANEQTPSVRQLRRIRDISTLPDGSVEFTMDYVQ
jgi:predicted small secreted protein